MYERQKKLLWSQLKVGLLITGALGVMFATVFFWGQITSVFVPKAEVRARFPAVAGLRIGAPVWLLGVEIGTVKYIDLDQGFVSVGLSVRENNLELIHQDATASILTIGLLGDKYVAIEPGSSAKPSIDNGATIEGENPPGMAEIVETSAKSIQKVDEFLNLFEGLVDDIEEGRGTIGQLLSDTLLYQELRATISNLAVVTNKVRNGDGTAAKLIEDPTMYNELTRAGSELSRFGAQLNDTANTISRLTSSAELYNHLLDASAQLDTVMNRIENGEGLAGTVISDPELARELRNTMNNVNGLMEDIKENPKKYFSFELF